MQMASEQIPDIRCELQAPSFATSARPMTMGLAASIRIQLWKYLENTPTSWPFSDRVLVWLLPSMDADVVKFHANQGRSMVHVFNAHQIESIDAALLRILMAKIRSVEPVVLHWLIDVLRSVKEVNQQPRQWHHEILKFLPEVE